MERITYTNNDSVDLWLYEQPTMDGVWYCPVCVFERLDMPALLKDFHLSCHIFFTILLNLFEL